MLQNFVVDLSNYKVIQKIDENTYQNRFLIEDQKNQNKYVAHVYKDECIKPDQQKQFINEVQTYFQYQYLTLFRAVGYNLFDFQSKPCPTIIFEYLPQGTLRKLLDQVEKGEVPSFWTDTNRFCIIFGIAAGLRYLQSNNIIHQNLTTETILLDDHYVPRIIYQNTNDSQAEKINSNADYLSFAKIIYEIITLKQSPINISEIPGAKNQEFFTKCQSTEPSQKLSSDELFEYISDCDFLRLFPKLDYSELKGFLDLFLNKNDWKIRITFLFNDNLSKNDVVKPEAELSNLKKFADEGDSDAMYYFYFLSEGKKDDEERLRYLKMAVDEEQTQALFIYAKKLQTGGKNVEKNIIDALFYLKLAANKGCRDSMVEYALLRSEGRNGAPVDKKEAARYFKMAADKKSKVGIEKYIEMLRKGDGIPEDQKEADRYSEMIKYADKDCIIC